MGRKKATTACLGRWTSTLAFNTTASDDRGDGGCIQGDGRKFLRHLKRHFGPQISSDSLNFGPQISPDSPKQVISSEWSQHLQQKWFWLQSVNGWVLSTRSIVLPTSAFRKRARLLRNYIWIKCLKGAYAHWRTQIWYSSLSFANCGFIRFVWLFGWFGWYLWPKMAHKMSQEFPTVSLDITEIANNMRSRAILALNRTTGQLLNHYMLWGQKLELPSTGR